MDNDEPPEDNEDGRECLHCLFWQTVVDWEEVDHVDEVTEYTDVFHALTLIVGDVIELTSLNPEAMNDKLVYFTERMKKVFEEKHKLRTQVQAELDAEKADNGEDVDPDRIIH